MTTLRVSDGSPLIVSSGEGFNIRGSLVDQDGEPLLSTQTLSLTLVDSGGKVISDRYKDDVIAFLDGSDFDIPIMSADTKLPSTAVPCEDVVIYGYLEYTWLDATGKPRTSIEPFQFTVRQHHDRFPPADSVSAGELTGIAP